MSAAARPTSLPYFKTVSPFLISRRAILWPSGTASSDFTLMVSSVSMTQPVNSCPAAVFSTTMTPTVSALSCTMKCVSISFLSNCETNLTDFGCACRTLVTFSKQTRHLGGSTRHFYSDGAFCQAGVALTDGFQHIAQAGHTFARTLRRAIRMAQAHGTPAPDSAVQHSYH